jgi:Cu2+-exporting ATPase
MTAPAAGLCSHCLLPVGCRPTMRRVNGTPLVFCCYGCVIAYQVRHGNGTEWEATWLLIRLGVGAFLAMNVMLFSLLLYSGTFDRADRELVPLVHVLLWLLATPALLILGWPFLRDAGRDILHRRVTSSALIVVGAGGAYAYSVLAMMTHSKHVYFDTAAMLLVLFTLGRYLEALGRARAARSLAPLLEAERQLVSVIENGIETHRRVAEVEAGAKVRVRPGERIPVDGIVVDGCSHVDEAAITGESRLFEKAPRSKVLAGSINQDGSLLIRSVSAGSASAWAGICRAVRDALARESPTQRVVDRVAGIFVPGVLIAAGLTLLYWSARQPLDQALLASLAVLVVACPCALALAAPLATSIGIGRLARRGCIARDAAVLENLSRIKIVAFDKTGTLTHGTPRVIAIDADGASADDVVRHAAALERHSEHALARGILAAAAQRKLASMQIRQARAIAGRGITGLADDQVVAVGARALMTALGWSVPPALALRAQSLEGTGNTAVYVGWAGRVRGVVLLGDTLLPEARATILALRGQTLRTVLLTGDLPEAARRAADDADADAWQAELSPEQKRDAVSDLRRSHGPVAMVGDGLNDGPVLAAADVGIAVNSATDLARETADLILPEGGLSLLPWAIGLARDVRRTIVTNLLWALVYNAAGLALAALGLFQPVAAAALMAGSGLLVVLNSLRLERAVADSPDEGTDSTQRQADFEVANLHVRSMT